MTLKEYFKTHPDVTKRDIAIACNTDTATVFRWVTGATPSLKMVLLIEEATGGKVKPRDLIGGSIENGAETVSKRPRKRAI